MKLSSKSTKSTILMFTLCLMVIFSQFISAQAATSNSELLELLEQKYPDGIPHFITPEEKEWLEQQEPVQPLTTEALSEEGLLYTPPPGATDPPSGATWTPGEFDPLAGILVRWTTGTRYDTALRGLVAQASQATTVWCFVESSYEQSTATTAFNNAGANMSNVQFITKDLDRIWIRDYGPRYFYENNGHAVMDHTYNRPYANDNGLPEWLANYWSDPYYDFALTHGGGNFHAFSNGEAFMSTLILDENPGYSEQDIKDIMRDYFNVDLTIFPRLPLTVDGTGHIDMWFLPVGPDKVIISQFSTNNNGEQTITNNAAAEMAARGYTVYRVPAWIATVDGYVTNYTYTNSVIVNGTSKRVIIPSYSGYTTNNNTAKAVFESAMPDYTVVQVDCSAIIPLAGAVHCIMKHVYAPTFPIPTIEVTAANGDEWWKVGTTQQIEWVASDDVSVSSISLDYSTDNGDNWNTITTGLANTGTYNWTVPTAESNECLIRATVYDGASNSMQDVSDNFFTISVNDPPTPAEPPASGTVTTNTSNASRTSATFSHTVAAGDDRLLVVSVMFEGDDSVSSITYAGYSLTQATTRKSGSSSGCGVEIWYLVDPPVGTASVVVNFGTSVVPSGITAVNFTGVDQSDPIGATAGAYASSGTSVTTSITTENTNSLIFGAATGHGGDTYPYSPGSGITELWDSRTGTSSYADAGLWGGEREAATAG
ncbi:MAG: agmatine deiminase family protein, partial [Phycisphaerae bacterium]